MDTSGKDGTIKSVMSGVNPQGCKVVSFKAPSSEELGHDFLWRVHQKAPPKGQIGIFNRSHYEDVLITRVHGWVSDKVVKQRFNQIKEFEELLYESGTTILKFFLHISKNEQKERLEERIRDPEKRWKFNEGDLEERKLWKKYMDAFEDMMAATSTDHAPWYIVPANTEMVSKSRDRRSCRQRHGGHETEDTARSRRSQLRDVEDRVTRSVCPQADSIFQSMMNLNEDPRVRVAESCSDIRSVHSGRGCFLTPWAGLY